MKIIGAILVLLLAGASAAAAQAADAAELYRLNCKKCHGVRGTPPRTIKKKMSKIPTFNMEFAKAVDTDSIVTVLMKGGNSEDMKSFSEKMTPQEMAAVAAYVRKLALKAPAPDGS